MTPHVRAPGPHARAPSPRTIVFKLKRAAINSLPNAVSLVRIRLLAKGGAKTAIRTRFEMRSTMKNRGCPRF